MPILLQGLLIALFAAAVSLLIYPPARRFALHRGILDNPNARKLQRQPVPVLGGVVVYAGLLAGLLVLSSAHGTHRMMVATLALTVMLLIGLWDDLRGLPAAFRFLVEILIVWILMRAGDFCINDFHGAFGLHAISIGWAAPLSILAGVGIINAINLIDGVDGYSSGFGIVACLVFAGPLFGVGAGVPGSCLLILAGALVPFFLHNVFGKRSKMFIGDAGTLMLGTAMTIAVFYILDTDSPCAALEQRGFGLLAYTLAVLCIPVFDTLRVMVWRMVKGLSPFEPDKTHLHHLFIELGFSHVGTALCIILANIAIVLLWMLSWLLGASPTWQLVIVVALGLFVTTGWYALVRYHRIHDTRYYRYLCGHGEKSHRFMVRAWRAIRRLVDRPIALRSQARLRHATKQLLKKLWGGER